MNVLHNFKWPLHHNWLGICHQLNGRRTMLSYRPYAWRHVSITTTPCWGSRLVALRAHVVLAERISPSVSARPGPARPARRYGMQGWPAGCMLGDGPRGSASFDPQHTWAHFCDVICIWSIMQEHIFAVETTLNKLKSLLSDTLHWQCKFKLTVQVYIKLTHL